MAYTCYNRWAITTLQSPHNVSTPFYFDTLSLPRMIQIATSAFDFNIFELLTLGIFTIIIIII